MAAQYVSSSNAASATPAADMRTALDAVILAHPNWSLVEAINITGGTARVYKCAGTGNSWGQDFYMAMMILTASPTILYFQFFEAYNANGGATSSAVRPVRNAGFAQGVTLPPNGNGYIVDNNGVTLDVSNGNISRFALTLNATDIIPWACHVSKSRFEFMAWLTSTGNAPAVVIGGLYVPNPRAVASVNAVFPLFGLAFPPNNTIISGPGSTNSISSYPIYFSREYTSNAQFPQGGLLIPSSSNACGLINTSTPIIDPVEGAIRGTGILVMGSISSPSAGSGYIRGSLPGAYAFFASGNAMHPGDLIVLSDATQLMSIAPYTGGASMGAFVDIASDN